MIHEKVDYDTVIEEIHQTRQRMAEKFGGDITAILEDASKRQGVSGRRIWQGPSPKMPAGQDHRFEEPQNPR